MARQKFISETGDRRKVYECTDLQNKCVGCGRCLSVCPGNLLKKGEDGKYVSAISETAGDVPPV